MTLNYSVKLLPKFRNIRNYSLITIISVMLILLIGALTPSTWFYDDSENCDVNIYVANTGFHSDIIIPIKTEVFDWNEFISLEDIDKDNNQRYNYLTFG